MLAYGISAVSANVRYCSRNCGDGSQSRAQAYRFITGKTAIIQEAAIKILGPRIGGMITRRAILKVTVPVAGVAISSGWNYVSTKGIAEAGRTRIEIRSPDATAAD